MRRGRRPDPAVAWKRSQTALLALRKTLIVARREGWISVGESSALNTYLLEMERVLIAALGQPEPESESKAVLRSPLKPNGDSAAKPIRIPQETDQTSERSDAGFLIVR